MTNERDRLKSLVGQLRRELADSQEVVKENDRFIAELRAEHARDLEGKENQISALRSIHESNIEKKNSDLRDLANSLREEKRSSRDLEQ